MSQVDKIVLGTRSRPRSQVRDWSLFWHNLFTTKQRLDQNSPHTLFEDEDEYQDDYERAPVNVCGSANLNPASRQRRISSAAASGTQPR
jgi:hypothetical protein